MVAPDRMYFMVKPGQLSLPMASQAVPMVVYKYWFIPVSTVLLAVQLMVGGVVSIEPTPRGAVAVG